jgi:hypothetical protein
MHGSELAEELAVRGVMRIYRYKSPIGTFTIKPQADGRWGLWFQDDKLGSYQSAVAAADDVYCRATGNYDWDSRDEVDVPTDVGEWESIVCSNR